MCSAVPSHWLRQQLCIHKIDEPALATYRRDRSMNSLEGETLCLNASFWRRFRQLPRACFGWPTISLSHATSKR